MNEMIAVFNGMMSGSMALTYQLFGAIANPGKYPIDRNFGDRAEKQTVFRLNRFRLTNNL
jgi:hypothetical protein